MINTMQAPQASIANLLPECYSVHISHQTLDLNDLPLQRATSNEYSPRNWH